MKKYFFKETGDELPEELESMDNIQDILKELLENGIIIEKDDNKHEPIDFSEDDKPENEEPDDEEEDNMEEDNEDSFVDVPSALLDYIDHLDQVLMTMTDEIVSLDNKVSKMDKSIKELKKSIGHLASCTSTSDPITKFFFTPSDENTSYPLTKFSFTPFNKGITIF